MTNAMKGQTPPRNMKESMSRLQEVNEAEWTNVQSFLQKSQKKQERSKTDEKLRGRWTGIHERARINDSEGLHDVIGGRRGQPLQPADATTESGWTSLHVAAMCNSAAAAAAAIEGNADIFKKDLHGKSPLHAAAANNAVEAMTHIIAMAKRNNVSGTLDDEGNTPLHAAAAAGSLEACRYLLNAGADPHARNHRGRTPQDVATTAKFKLANELLAHGLEAFSKFRKLQLRPRTQRLLVASKPALGTYPVRLRPNSDVCSNHRLDFVVGPVSCKPGPSWLEVLRDSSFASSLKYRNSSDRVKLQQAVLIAQNLYPQLAGMGLASSTPAFRRKIQLQQLQAEAQQLQHALIQAHALSPVRRASANLNAGSGRISPGADSKPSSPMPSARNLLPSIVREASATLQKSSSPGGRQGSPYSAGDRAMPVVSAGSPLPNRRPGSNSGPSRSGSKGSNGRGRDGAAPRVRMEVTEGARKMVSLLWSKAWSDAKGQAEIPVLEVQVSKAEGAWRQLAADTVDTLARIEANWSRDVERGYAVGDNKLDGGRFELSPPAWRLLLAGRALAGAAGAEPQQENARAAAGKQEGREYDVDAAQVFSDMPVRQLEALYRSLGFHAISDAEYLKRVPYPVDFHTLRRRANAGYYRCYDQVVCGFLDMCMNWLAFDWTVRSDTQETYRAALSLAEQGMQVLMQRKEAIEEAEDVVREEEEEAVRDSIMLQAEECARSGAERVGRASKRMAAMNELLGRCPALADQIMQFGEGWSVESQEVDNLEYFAARLGEAAYELNKDGERVMLIPSKLEKLRADRLVKICRFISTGQQKFLDQVRDGPGGSSGSGKADVWRASDEPGGEELPSVQEHRDEETGGAKDSDEAKRLEGEGEGAHPSRGGAQRMESVQDEGDEGQNKADTRTDAGAADASGSGSGAGVERADLMQADADENRTCGGAVSIRGLGGIQSRGTVRSSVSASRAGSFRSSRSLQTGGSGGSARSDRSDASTAVLRGADGSHLTLFAVLMPDGRRRKDWRRGLKELAVALGSVDVKRVFQSDKEYDRYGRVRKRIVKFHPFDTDVEVSDGDYRRVEGKDGESMEVLARAGGKLFSSDMEKINAKLLAGTYDVMEKMQVDLYLIVMYTLLNQLSERERMKNLCDPRGAAFGGAEPSLLAPAMPSRVWGGELGIYGAGAKAVAWSAVHWHRSHHLGGWTNLARKQEQSRHGKERILQRRPSFPQIEYQIHIQPLPFTLPLHDAPCQCANHYSHIILSTGTDSVSDASRSSSSSASGLGGGKSPSAVVVSKDDGTRTCVLRGLQCAHEYEIKVRAVVVKPGTLDDEAGGLGGMMRSSWSKSVFISTPLAPPSAPLRLKPKHITQTSLVMSLQAPRLLFNSPLSDCELSYRIRRIGNIVMQTKKGGRTNAAAQVIRSIQELQAGGAAVWQGGERRAGFWTHSITIEPLLPATEVECLVRARNEAGWGEKTVAIVCRTLPARPLAPRDVELVMSSAGGLEVRWREPLLSNSRGRVLRYFVKGKEEDAGAAKADTMTADVVLVPAPREWMEAVQGLEAEAQEEHEERDEPERRLRTGAEDADAEDVEHEAGSEEEEEEVPHELVYEFDKEKAAMCLTAEERATRGLHRGTEERDRPVTSGERRWVGEDENAGEMLWEAWEGQRVSGAMRGGCMSRKIVGIGPAKSISVSVQALNEKGTSEWVHSNVVTTPSWRPSAPRGVTLEGYSHKDLVLRWTRGDEGGSEVVLYRVRYVTQGKVVSKLINGGVLGVTLAGFKPEQQVEEVSITALNALGSSEPSSPLLSCSTLPAPVSVNR